MPMRIFKCSKCEHEIELIVGATTGAKAPTDCPECEEKDCMEMQFSMRGITGEVVGGYDYEYGKKSWKRNSTMAEKAGILSGDKDPY